MQLNSRFIYRTLLVTGLGVGVHLTLSSSFSFSCRLSSQPAERVIASARLVAAVPKVVLSSSRLAAGVSEPGVAATFRWGVHDGGGITPFLTVAPSADMGFFPEE